MIEELFVKDYVLFEKASINFKTGMSVITGETGAGKSLLIDAILLLSGSRITSNVVRNGAEKAILQMVLTDIDESILNELEENGFEPEEPLIIQRTITSSLKSTMRINQQVTTNSFVKKIVSKMIDIHSQMDTYQLMNQDIQLDLLDQYAKTIELKESVSKQYKTLTNVQNELKKVKEETYSDDALEYATLQYNEIEDADIQENELEELHQRISEASKSTKTLEDLNTSIYSLDKENGLLDSLYLLDKILDKNNIQLNSIDVHDMYYQLSDLSEFLKEKRESLQRDNEELDSLQEREYLIKKLFRKHGGSYTSMMEAKEKYMKTIDSIIHRQDVIERLESQVTQEMNQYMSLAQTLSTQRQKVFKALSKQLESHFHDLMLEKARFEISRKEKNPSSDGIDDIHFMVSMNPGQPFSYLKDSASGGELSRLMLALKVVFQSQKGIKTIIFDEIDTGVSGKVAFAMGQKMKMLSNDYQVLCVTHLASVATWANNHYHVYKSSDTNSTSTSIKTLTDTEMLEELATMSSGVVSEASLKAALELKERVKENG